LDIAKELNLTWLLESTQNSLGLLFFHEQDFDRALYYYHESLKQNDITKNMIAKADLMNNLGMVYSNTNQLEKAIEYYMNGLHIRLEHFAHDYFRLGHTYTNLGAAEMKFGDLENAEIHLIDAFENYSKIPNNKYFHKRIYIHLANLNLIKKDLVKVEEYINKFESIGETENVVNDRIMNELYLQVKSEYLFELGNYKDSLEYFKRLSTSLITNAENKVDKLSEKYEMKIDYEKKKTEAEILKIKNNELAKTNATKDKLLSLIAHDMRAPLANIIEVLKILATDKSSIPADELDIILNELLDDTSAVYELLQTLLSWVRTQTETFTVNKAEVRIRQLVESACQHMHFLITKKSQKCKIDIPDNQTIYIDQNMLFFIIRNLISNAVKFTPENGIIEIYTNIVKDRLHLSVKDTGVGITEEKLNSIFEFSLDKSTRGTDNEKGSGLGLLLCRDFAKLNDVEIVIESKVDSGSIFSLSIPITQR
jgi:signal transduction histidine kinase